MTGSPRSSARQYRPASYSALDKKPRNMTSDSSAENVSFVDGRWPARSFRCLAQIRAHATAVPVTAEPVEEGQLQIRFDEGQRAVTPGQAVVLYDGDVVIGGGRIAVTEQVAG